MNYSKDYENIRTIIDEIIGLDTQQGSNLDMAIKKYFELKHIYIKLVSDKNLDYTSKLKSLDIHLFFFQLYPLELNYKHQQFPYLNPKFWN